MLQNSSTTQGIERLRADILKDLKKKRHSSSDELMRYLKGKLSAAECASVEEHIGLCSLCSREMDSLRDLRDYLASRV